MPEIKRYPLPDADATVDAVILADGCFPTEGTIAHAILRKAEYVVCCDGSADKFISQGGSPTAIVGDCDSISEETLGKFRGITQIITEQESNDLTKAFRYCVAAGKIRIIILGATGRREDHTIANVSLLSDYAESAEVCIVTDSGVFDAIRETAVFECFRGQQVSIFTIDTATALSVEGLRYIPPPDGLCSWWRGSLNNAEGNEFKIGTCGRTIVFRVF